ncbi:PREDICTED: proton pump-interactor 1-like isoform X2 [Lupinus angustifolius]|uniref:proton pump-interactor 1-like isoform X2 n=1 Tax=Lupinus angustifolius TaxID=3871 RepID=UPI00092F1ED8|nr:PREDICTED: proton pump-interactor 1-like isoform X2 [Lupinus angustifolius]
MALEVAGFEAVQGPVENDAEIGQSVLHEKDNSKLEQALGAGEPIKFGSHGDESAKGDVKDVLEATVPKDAVEEWPAPKQIHSFYFVRCRPYDDPNIKSKIDQIDKEMNKKSQARFRVTEALKAKRSERAELISQIKSLNGDRRQYQSTVDEKLREIGPLQQALGKLRTANNAGRGGLCSSEEELNDVIYSLQYRIQHESIPLSEEKQIIREIKQLEGTREKVIANAAVRAKLQESIGQKDAIKDQVKQMGGDLSGVIKERQAISAKIKKIDEELKTIDKEIQSLQDELEAITKKKDKDFEGIQQLRKQRGDANAYFYQSRQLLNKAKELAAKKDINALEEFAQTEVENFMSLWNSDKTFRNDYEKRILTSLDVRQLSRDGRIRNPNEKPLVEVPKPAEADALSKTIPKHPKEEPKPSPQETLPTQVAEKETKNKNKDSKSKPDNKDLAEAGEFEYENPHKETPIKKPEIDAKKLKEIKREEEIAKQKLALERKKKLAEKAAIKAAQRAQKEAEKKLKKAKKKTSGTTAEEPEDAGVEATEPEKVDDNVETEVEVAAPVKEKVPKAGIRSRSRAVGPDPIKKAIVKRKKSNNYLVWAAAAALLVLVLLVLGYTYLF